MAEKTTKPKRKAAASAKPSSDGSLLRQLSDARYERRYEPTTSPFAIVTVLLFSLGAVALGAGVYAQWLRSADGPHPYALYILIAGAVVLLGVALFGQGPARPVRVGDGGVAIEREDNNMERIAWCDISRLLVDGSTVTVQGDGTTISVSRGVHAAAAARIVSEARDRVPSKVGDDVQVKAPEGAADPAKERLEPPQIAGKTCKASGTVISFEKDARLCGRCGELYHKKSVPDRCLTCEAPLK
ncbi:MAG: hypothetical protein IPK82_28025 [Polyangiaceae bacterium]|nr:hypothetical protein [Polyangiaceae bacterium]